MLEILVLQKIEIVQKKKIRNHERMQNEQVRTYALSKKIVQNMFFLPSKSFFDMEYGLY